MDVLKQQDVAIVQTVDRIVNRWIRAGCECHLGGASNRQASHLKLIERSRRGAIPRGRIVSVLKEDRHDVGGHRIRRIAGGNRAGLNRRTQPRLPDWIASATSYKVFGGPVTSGFK